MKPNINDRLIVLLAMRAPETKGNTLEEIEAVRDHPATVRPQPAAIHTTGASTQLDPRN